MDERQQLRQTSLRFHSELDRVLQGNFADMPRPVVQLLDAIECEPVLNAYLTDCVEHHAPEGFDAATEYERVSEEADAVFGPFDHERQAATAQTYLILREMVERRTKFHDPVFSGYDGETHTLQERFAAFVGDVIMRLVNDISAHLDELGQALGCEAQSSASAADSSAQKSTSPSSSAADPVDTARLQTLLLELRESAQSLPTEDREDAFLQIEALEDELLCPQPKTRVVRVLLRGLHALSSSTAFDVALSQLEAVL